MWELPFWPRKPLGPFFFGGMVNRIGIGENDMELKMTLVSVFYDANINPLRKIATKRAVSCWFKQKNIPSEMLFIELGFNGNFTF